MPKRGEAFTFYTELVDAADTTLFKSNPTIAAGDVQISLAGGTFANLTNLPTVSPVGSTQVKVELTAAEMAGADRTVQFHDAVGGEWLDQAIHITADEQVIDDLATQASVDALNDLDAAGVRTAVGLATANLDTQIGTLGDQIDGAPAASWAYGTRTLTMTAAEIEAALSGDTITAHRGDSLSVSLAGLGSLAGYVSLDFTVKRSKSDSDDEAIIRIRKDASGVGDGLLRLNGAEAMAGDGSLVIDDEAAGNITVNLAASAMAELTAWSGYHYDVQMISATAVDTRMEGTFNVTADVTRAVV